MTEGRQDTAPRWFWISLGLAIILTPCTAGGVAQLHRSWILVPAPAVQATSQEVSIPPDEGPIAVADRLYRAGVIQSRAGFVALALRHGTAGALKPGTYMIPEGSNTVRVLRFLEEGETKPNTFTVLEGWTVGQVARALEAEGLARGEGVMRLSRDRAFLRQMGIEGPSLEGYLHPGTYHLFRGDSTREILSRMVRRLQREVEVSGPLSGRLEATGLTLHQVLTLASLIETEAAVDSEMPLISAVFWNRLRRHMRLEAEPTVRYALNKHRQSLTPQDLRADSPFNTYRHPGLPPGPIANPGKAAILAALNPAKVRYLYFVSRDGLRHAFSVTQRQHQAAAARIRSAKDPGTSRPVPPRHGSGGPSQVNAASPAQSSDTTQG